MSQAAVPQGVNEIANGFRDAAPGHRFNLYCPIWTDDWRVDSKGKTRALAQTIDTPKAVLALLEALRERQRQAIALAQEYLSIPAVNLSPFSTGLGHEHPVDNGFAFLTPYGLPYLAGSGVKGVLRRAAEEMALFPDEYGADQAEHLDSFTILDVWWLFGFEGSAGAWWPLTQKEEGALSVNQKEGRERWRERFDQHCQRLIHRTDLAEFITRAMPDPEKRARYIAEPEAFLSNLPTLTLRSGIHTRGALDVWDVFPDPKNGRLTVEIMTPHYSDYYQREISSAYPDGTTPHDAGQPIPIPFLAVPAGSRFEFHLICHPDRLPADIAGRWRPMVDAIVNHAFDWLGFGAKTAVGYGQMAEDLVVRESRRAEQRDAEEAAQRQAALAALSPIERSIAEAMAAKADPGLSDGVYLVQLLEAGRWEDEEASEAAAIAREKLKEEKKWKESTKKPDRDKDYKRTQSVLKYLARG